MLLWTLYWTLYWTFYWMLLYWTSFWMLQWDLFGCFLEGDFLKDFIWKLLDAFLALFIDPVIFDLLLSMLFQKLSQSIVKNELLLSFLKSRASFSQVLFQFLIAKAICGAASLHTFIGCCPLTLLKRLLASNYTITYVFLYYLQEILETHFTNRQEIWLFLICM